MKIQNRYLGVEIRFRISRLIADPKSGLIQIFRSNAPQDRFLVESDVTLLYTFVSKKEISVFDISAVNFIVEWKLFAFSTKVSILCRLVFHREQMNRQHIFSKTAVQSVQYKSISVSIFGLLDFGLEDISKSNGYLCFHVCPMGL